MNNQNPDNTNMGSAPAAPKKPRSFGFKIWVIILLLLAAVALWFWQKKYPITKKPVVYNSLPKGYEYKDSPKGEYPEGFPKELVLSIGSKEILRAEDTRVATGENYKIVEVKTADKPDSLAGLYRNTLTNSANNWQLVNSSSTNTATVLNFKKDSGTLAVTIVPSGEGSVLNLTYIPINK